MGRVVLGRVVFGASCLWATSIGTMVRTIVATVVVRFVL